MKKEIALNIDKLRKVSPIVHNITNFVVMNWTANALLAAGASPIMAHAEEEIEEILAISQALVINIGTLDDRFIQSMSVAVRFAKGFKKPVVLDPVGSGASKLRTQTSLDLLKSEAITVVRGNASEIISLVDENQKPKGVDSLHSSQAAIESAKVLSRKWRTVVCISGETDWIVKDESVIGIKNGHPMMTKVTGMGCVATALIGAFLAIEPRADIAALSGMAMISIAGELAARKANGLGDFQSKFLDELCFIDSKKVFESLNLAA